MFLPEKIPFVEYNPISSVRCHVKDVIFEDNGFGFKLLKECAVDENPFCKHAYILLSIMYYSGCVSDRDIKLANKYFNKYLQHVDDFVEEEESKDFIKWYKKALAGANEPIFD